MTTLEPPKYRNIWLVHGEYRNRSAVPVGVWTKRIECRGSNEAMEIAEAAQQRQTVGAMRTAVAVRAVHIRQLGKDRI